MIPPIKRPTLTADTLFAGRAKSSSPALFERTFRQPKPPDYQMALNECQLLELIQKKPGQTVQNLCQKMPQRSEAWVYKTLRSYEEVGVVCRIQSSGQRSSVRWYLT